ncbi:MAG TPA: metallophosphoesterase [Nitrososphaeraceae archaeon]|jgi:predicted phosphodiesterase
MIKIQFVLYPLLITIFVTLFISISYSQNVTNQNTTNQNTTSSTIFNGSKKNDSSVTVINAAGDMDCSNHLVDQVKSDNPDLFIALGDLCYKANLTNFTNIYGDLIKANKLACIVGNHDSEEDGNSKILNQALKLCGDHWYRKIANDTTLLIALNTNGDTELQMKWGQSVVTNGTLMNGIKNVVLLAHKPAHTPESHHPVRNSTIVMVSGIESNVSKSVQVYEISAHNHIMAESRNGHWFISGAGGRSHYEGEPSPEWPYVNTKDYGYLQIRINNTDGNVLSTNFYGLYGRLLH